MQALKQRILAAVQSDLARIEAALEEHLNPHFDLVRQVAGHLLFAGGKRLRPLLTLLSARLCGNHSSAVFAVAIIFEYLHAATLLHDDLVDGADMRRGKAVAHQRWDNPTAVLTGDFLLARSLRLAAATGLPEVIDTMATVTEAMAQGEIQQLDRKGQTDLSEAEYLDIIRCKTAELFQGACRTGALVAGGSAAQVQRLSDFGFHLGMAFQMADDLLDYTQATDVLGKKMGADLKEGKLTLPVIHTLARASAAHRTWMTAVIGRQTFSPSDFSRLLQLMQDYGGIAYTRQQAETHIRTARQALAGMDDAPAKAIMLDIADYALARNT